jgi:chromosome segregation ATPase
MSKFNKAADDIQNLANRLRPLLDLQDFLQEIGSLDQAASEAGVRKEKAVKDAEYATACLLDAKKDLEKVYNDISLAEDKAQEILDNAKAKAVAIIEAANIKAADIGYAMDKKQADLDTKFSDACKELAGVQADILDKKNELENVKAQVSSIKSKLQAFVGG